MDEKDLILIQVVELYLGRSNTQESADVMNQAGVSCGLGKTTWNAKGLDRTGAVFSHIRDDPWRLPQTERAEP